MPIAFESLGPVNRSGLKFIAKVRRRISAISSESLETSHPLQCLSICTKHYKGVPFSDTFVDCNSDEDR